MASPPPSSGTSPHVAPPPRGGMSLAALILLALLLTAPVLALLKAADWVDGRVLAGGLVAVNLIVFVAYAVDKRSAARGGRRIPEWTLHLGELLGGWPAAFLAQRWLRHKSSKLAYQVVFWLIVLLHQAVAVDANLGGRLSEDFGLVVRQLFRS